MGKGVGGLPMVGGCGDNSYLHNSRFQRSMYESVRDTLHNAVQTKFDFSTLNGTVRIVDLGCAMGPNTFYAVQAIIDAFVAAVHKPALLPGSDQNAAALEFQVFFNDQVGNDFNLLLSTLPSDRRYFAAAVPGSFYSRLFPGASIHFFNSSMALHWLSKAPAGMSNKGRIHTYEADPDIRNAYLTQLMADMDVFLSARAEELVVGGLISVLIICHEPTAKNLPYEDFFGMMLDPLFRKLVLQGKLKQEALDDFQLPLYLPTIEEFKEAVKANGRFNVDVATIIDEWWDLGDHGDELNIEQSAVSIANTCRAVHEEVLKSHFGGEVVDQVFAMLPGQLQGYLATHRARQVFPPIGFFILQLKPSHGSA